jgi:hypothetical protein
MKVSSNVFNLDETKKIIVDSDFPFKEVLPFDDVIIKFSNDFLFNLTEDCFQYLMNSLKGALTKGLKNHLQIPDFIDEDIGLLWNKELNNTKQWSMTNHDQQMLNNPESLGEYILFSTSGETYPSLATWIYNNKNGEIVFQITPQYKWHFDDPKDGENFITYDEFIRNYKPLFTGIISPAVAKKWLKKINALLKLAKTNEQKCRAEQNQ